MGGEWFLKALRLDTQAPISFYRLVPAIWAANHRLSAAKTGGSAHNNGFHIQGPVLHMLAEEIEVLSF